MSTRTSAVVRLAFAVVSCPYASLSAQSRDLAQYEHTAWGVRDGAPGGISYLAQGADGVLWIASARGLFQFDGVRFERFEPPPGQTLLPHAPNVLLALPDTVTSAPGAGTEVVLVLPEHSGWSALWRRLVRMGGRDGPDAP